MTRRFKTATLIAAATALFVLPVVEWVRLSYFDILWPGPLHTAGSLLSLIGFVFLFIQFVLSSRVRLFESSLGLDRLIAVHRITGIITLCAFVLHAVCLFLFELFLGYLSISIGKIIGMATMALIIVGAGGALFWRALGWRYETWKRLHYAGYLVLPIGLLHATRIGLTVNSSSLLRVYYLVLVGLWVVVVLSRVVRSLRALRHPYVVTAIVRESHDIVSVHLEGPSLRFRAGQFMIVRLIEDGRVSETHPYTISSSPLEAQLRISAKAIGDFSGHLPEVPIGSRAICEGPFGAFTCDTLPGSTFVFIAGGIGITPFLSHLAALRERKDDRRIRLIWGNKTRQDIAFGRELADAERELVDFHVIHVLSDENWEGESGFVNAALVQRHINSIEEAEFLVCGPPPMMRSVIPTLRSLGVKRSRVQFERFSLGR
jgi:predicted ferric reductase